MYKIFTALSLLLAASCSLSGEHHEVAMYQKTDRYKFIVDGSLVYLFDGQTGNAWVARKPVYKEDTYTWLPLPTPPPIPE